MVLSERSLNSLLWQMHQNDQISFDYEMSSTLIKTFFPNFEEVFGHTDKQKIILKSKTAPVAVIRAGESSVNFTATLTFLNPFDE